MHYEAANEDECTSLVMKYMKLGDSYMYVATLHFHHQSTALL